MLPESSSFFDHDSQGKPDAAMSIVDSPGSSEDAQCFPDFGRLIMFEAVDMEVKTFSLA